jgi:hypothetical protein
MTIERKQIFTLWPLDEIPFCDEGLDLAGIFMERSFEACNTLDEEDAMPKRNAMIRAHKELVAHRGPCRKCNQADPVQ